LQPAAVRIGCVRVPGLDGGFDARRLHIGELKVLRRERERGVLSPDRAWQYSLRIDRG
jgi:hypothetical protein